MNKTIDKIFNWKKNPHSVFFFVIPLALIKFICLLVFSGLQIYHYSNYVYMVITVVGLVVFVIAMYPVYRILKTIKRPNPVEKLTNVNQ